MPGPIHPKQRQLIIALWDEGNRVCDIQKKTGISRKTVSFWLRRWKESKTVVASRRTTYKRATTAAQDQAIIQAHIDNPLRSTKEDGREFAVSIETVRRRLREAGLRHKKLSGNTQLILQTAERSESTSSQNTSEHEFSPEPADQKLLKEPPQTELSSEQLNLVHPELEFTELTQKASEPELPQKRLGSKQVQNRPGLEIPQRVRESEPPEEKIESKTARKRERELPLNRIASELPQKAPETELQKTAPSLLPGTEELPQKSPKLSDKFLELKLRTLLQKQPEPKSQEHQKPPELNRTEVMRRRWELKFCELSKKRPVSKFREINQKSSEPTLRELLLKPVDPKILELLKTPNDSKPLSRAPQPVKIAEPKEAEPDDRVECSRCLVPIPSGGELYRCVQCSERTLLCAPCQRHAHRTHCLMRMPSTKVYRILEGIFNELTNDMEELLGKDNQVAGIDELIVSKSEEFTDSDELAEADELAESDGLVESNKMLESDRLAKAEELAKSDGSVEFDKLIEPDELAKSFKSDELNEVINGIEEIIDRMEPEAETDVSEEMDQFCTKGRSHVTLDEPEIQVAPPITNVLQIDPLSNLVKEEGTVENECISSIKTHNVSKAPESKQRSQVACKKQKRKENNDSAQQRTRTPKRAAVGNSPPLQTPHNAIVTFSNTSVTPGNVTVTPSYINLNNVNATLKLDNSIVKIANATVTPAGYIIVTPDCLTVLPVDAAVIAGHAAVTSSHATVTSGHASVTSGHPSVTFDHAALTSDPAVVTFGHTKLNSGHATVTSGHVAMTAGHAAMISNDVISFKTDPLAPDQV